MGREPMKFYIDIDNVERFKVKNTLLDYQLKDLAKDVKGGEFGIHLDIQGLGCVVIDNVILDFQLKAAVFKTHMIVDYRDKEQEERDTHIDIILMENDAWNSSLLT